MEEKKNKIKKIGRITFNVFIIVVIVFLSYSNYELNSKCEHLQKECNRIKEDMATWDQVELLMDSHRSIYHDYDDYDTHTQALDDISFQLRMNRMDNLLKQHFMFAPYKVHRKTKRKKFINVNRPENVDYVDAETGEVRHMVNLVGHTEIVDSTPFVKLYDYDSLMCLSLCGVRCLLYVMSAMQYGEKFRFDVSKCAEYVGCSRHYLSKTLCHFLIISSL